MNIIRALEIQEDELKKTIEEIKGDAELKRLKQEFSHLRDAVEKIEGQLSEQKSRVEDCLKQKGKIEKEIIESDNKDGKVWESIKNTSDLERLKLHVQKLKEMLPQIDDKKLAIERNIEKLNHEEADFKKKLSFIKHKFEKHKEELKIKINTKEQELDATRGNLDAIMSNISIDDLEAYEGLRVKYNNPIVKIIDNKCEGCGQELSTEQLAAVGINEADSKCTACGRFLIV